MIRTPAATIINEIIALALAHVTDRREFSEALERYYLDHQDDWRWDGETWDGPYRLWELRP